jgi:hypothetical protein
MTMVSATSKSLTLVFRLTLAALFLLMLATGPLVKPCSGQTDSSVSGSDAIDDQDLSQSETDQDSAPPDDHGEPNDADELPLSFPSGALLSPLHWGRLSLLSFGAYEEYNTNPEFLRIGLGRYLTSLSALAIYSTQFKGWLLTLRYQPFVWISPYDTYKDFLASSMGLRTGREINRNWKWTAGDSLRYSPIHGTYSGAAGEDLEINNAFLSTGQNVLVNGAAFVLTDRYTDNSSLIFNASQDYTRLTGFVSGGGLNFSAPEEEAVNYGAGVTWRHHFTSRDTLSLKYNFRAQRDTSNLNVDFDTASVGWNHKFNDSFGISGTIGPGWAIYDQTENGHSFTRDKTTIHGSLAAAKEFRTGGIALSFTRSDTFSGIISNSFQNRYELAARHAFSPRWRGSLTASYVQQQVYGVHNVNGELGAAQVRYFMTRNLALFTEARYVEIVGRERFFAPAKSAIVGVRWSWVPEKM